MRKFAWRTCAACFAAWLGIAAIVLGTGLALPRFNPTAEHAGCYLRDAMWVYVECAPSVPGGPIISGVANVAWAAPLFLATIPFLAKESLRRPRPGAMALASLAGLSFAGASFFACFAAGWLSGRLVERVTRRRP